MVITVGGKDLPFKVVRFMAKTLQVRQASGQHGRDMAMVLAVAEGLAMDNHLVLGIYEGLTVISLDGAVGSHHHGQIIVGNNTLSFSIRRTHRVENERVARIMLFTLNPCWMRCCRLFFRYRIRGSKNSPVRSTGLVAFSNSG
jgi:hypothetical protein